MVVFAHQRFDNTTYRRRGSIKRADTGLTSTGTVLGGRVRDDEVDHGLRVGEAVGVVSLAGLVDHKDLATEFAVAFFDDHRVFLRGNNVVGIPDHVHDRNSRLLERRKRIHRVAGVGQGFRLVGKAVGRQAGVPVAGAARS